MYPERPKLHRVLAFLSAIGLKGLYEYCLLGLLPIFCNFVLFQKRVTIYENSVKHFMGYFSKSDRVVQIDVTCGVHDIIWTKVCDFFVDLNFEAKKTPETVIVFGFGKTTCIY